MLIREDMPSLKSCPHCKMVGVLNSIDDFNTVFVVCTNCGFQTKSYKHIRDAIIKWNTRTDGE